MTEEKQDAAVRKAIHAHEHWKSKWREDRSAFSREMVSPRGKVFTYSGYCYEVQKHMDSTIKKIRKALGVKEAAE